jgi:hypothetical protein
VRILSQIQDVSQAADIAAKSTAYDKTENNNRPGRRNDIAFVWLEK